MPIKSANKKVSTKKDSQDEIKELKERLSVLEKIEAEKLKPKSEIRTTGKQFLPLVIGAFFAVCSGLAIYGVASSVQFYSDYGDVSSLLVSLLMLFALVLLVGIATWVIHKSEWGYKLRTTVVLLIVLFSSIGIGAVLMQGPVERFVDRFGINDNLRAEDRLLGESTVYGEVSEIRGNTFKVNLRGGGWINITVDSTTRFYPINSEVRVGQNVGVVLKSDSKVAKWIRLLPPEYPKNRVNIN